MTQGLIALGITAACFVAVMLFFRFLGKPQALGSSAGLNPCAGSPNCVCSTDARPAHHVEPWHSPHDPEQTAARLAVLVRDMPHARVTLHEPAGGYVRAEFRSVVFRFIDDVEFFLPGRRGREGHGDPGAVGQPGRAFGPGSEPQAGEDAAGGVGGEPGRRKALIATLQIF